MTNEREARERETRLRELCALELYGELDERDARELDALRASSAELDRLARDYAAELRAGLGALPTEPAASADELPAGWRDALHAAIAREPARRSSAVPAWIPISTAAAAAFVAGALLVWAGRPAGRETARAAEADGVFERFHAPEAPPPATAGSGLERFATLLR